MDGEEIPGKWNRGDAKDGFHEHLPSALFFTTFSVNTFSDWISMVLSSYTVSKTTMPFLWVRLLDITVERFLGYFGGDNWDVHNYDKGKATLSDQLSIESQMCFYISLKPELPHAEFEFFKS